MSDKILQSIYPVQPRFPIPVYSFFVSIIAISVYFPALWFGFSPMDEQWLIRDYTEELSNISNLPSLFLSPTAGMYYRPTWTSSFMFDLISGKGSPFAFHLTNILLHAVCCLLLFKTFCLFDIEKGISFWCAIIFAVHPINVHAVVWIPGRNDTLLCFFSLLSIYFLVRFIKRRDIVSLLMHYAGFCFALLSKENAVVLPVFFAVISLFLFQKNTSKQIFTMFIPWLLIGVGWFLLRKSIINVLPSSGISHLSDTMQNFLYAIVIYIGKCVLPIQQAIMPVVQNTSLLPGILVILSVVFLVIKFGFKEQRIAVLGIVWFFLFISVPTWVGATNNIGEHYEHRVYTSLVGFLLMVSQINIQYNRKYLTALCVIITIAFSIKTIYRYQVYKNEFSFANAAVIESPDVAILQNIVGLLYVKEKKFNKSIPYFTKAIELKPGKGEYYNNRAGCYSNLREFQNALTDYNKTVELMPGNGNAYLNRSMTHFSLGHIEAAANDLEQAMKLRTAGIQTEYVKELNSAFQNNIITSYAAKIEKNPFDAANYNIRGVAYFNLGNFEMALSDYNKAIELNPTSIEFIHNRHLLYSYTKDTENTLRDQQLLIKLGYNQSK